MKMKKGFVLLAGALSVAGFAAAYSYSAASVSSTATMSVVPTNQALFALSPGTGANDKTAIVDSNGELSLNFDEGNAGDGTYGLQPRSSYDWYDLFDITANTSTTNMYDDFKVTGIPSGVHVYVRENSSSQWIELYDGKLTPFGDISSTTPQKVDVRMDVDKGTTLSKNNSMTLWIGTWQH